MILPMGQGEVLHEGKDCAVIAIGSRVHPALEAARELEEEMGVSLTVFNARFVAPLPEAQLLELAASHDKLLTVEENVLAGGFGSAVLELLGDRNALSGKIVKRLGLPHSFVEHGAVKELLHQTGLDKDGIKSALRELVGEHLARGFLRADSGVSPPFERVGGNDFL